ncbi:lipase family protein [Paenibacillus filicis]|uniref:Lipase family protein n=1 Tax=Paenibacillus gyeongsangnamensis TaxID=3388067 RepID=A0ABT4QHL6_9BACL|nr:lipase family protein [Paenibacillus filicis]MCZ8516216.1 lipase family protein [Paenibacillus filicis]
MAIKVQRTIWLAAVVFQAVRQFKQQGAVTLPRGYRLVKQLGTGTSPFLGFILESEKNIVIAFRGTEDLLDLLRDLQFNQIPYRYASNAGATHQGLTRLYSDALRSPIRDTLQGTSPAKKLLLTGHSVGGSLATLCALDMAVNTAFLEPQVTTFGSPKVGNPTFARVFNKHVTNSRHIVNRSDLIPQLPLSIGETVYRHVQSRLELTFRNRSLIGSHRIEAYFRELSYLDPSYVRKLIRRSPGFCPEIREEGQS